MFDDLKPMDYVALQRSGDLDEKRAIGSYTKTGFVKKIPPQLIDAVVNGLEPHPGTRHHRWLPALWRSHFARRARCHGVPAPGNSRHVTAHRATGSPRTDPTAHLEWLRKYWKSIEPHTAGFYTNDVIDETQKQVDENYLGNYPRLVALKNQYDPKNLFRLNAQTWKTHGVAAENSPMNNWPDLPLAAWRDTRDTLHLWTQIVGKIRLAQTPWLNHGWHVALYVTTQRADDFRRSRTVTRSFEIEFDFIQHRLEIRTDDGVLERID